jgi:hypothetical protein
MKQNSGSLRRLALAAIAVFPLLLPTNAGSEGMPGGKIEIAEAGADPGFPPTYNEELKLRLKIVNKGPAAKGVFVETRQGTTLLKRTDIEKMGAGEQRTITLSTGFKPGAGESCLRLVPGAAPDSASPGGAPKQICLTPGCTTGPDNKTPGCYKVTNSPSL